jgi:hypothetical protein
MLPEPDVDAAHRHSIRHRGEIEASGACGCFYCLAVFPPSEVREWIDWPADTPAAQENARGQTALCPRCGIDSVIGDASGYPVTPGFLGRMEARWFGMREASAP